MIEKKADTYVMMMLLLSREWVGIYLFLAEQFFFILF